MVTLAVTLPSLLHLVFGVSVFNDTMACECLSCVSAEVDCVGIILAPAVYTTEELNLGSAMIPLIARQEGGQKWYCVLYGAGGQKGDHCAVRDSRKVCLYRGRDEFISLSRRQKLPYDINVHDDEGLLPKKLAKAAKAKVVVDNSKNFGKPYRLVQLGCNMSAFSQPSITGC
jgi:hypothetical protein